MRNRWPQVLMAAPGRDHDSVMRQAAHWGGGGGGGGGGGNSSLAVSNDRTGCIMGLDYIQHITGGHHQKLSSPEIAVTRYGHHQKLTSPDMDITRNGHHHIYMVMAISGDIYGYHQKLPSPDMAITRRN